MMTSALLHMLDTPEEVAAESHSDEEYRQHAAAEHYPTHHEIDPAMFERLSLHHPSDNTSNVHHNEEAPSYVDPVMFQELSLSDRQASASQLSAPSASHEDSSWSPTWHRSQDESAMSMLHHHQSHEPSANSTHDSDVGLYLP